MSTLRRPAAAATDLACRIVGRRQVVRAARFVLHRARLDIPNDLCSNGESSLQRWILELSPTGRQVSVLDVGANVGRWSVAMLAAASRAGRLDDLDLHAFEPSLFTFDRLTEALDGQPVNTCRLALSDRSGSSSMYITAPGAGTNSLHEPPGPMTTPMIEDVVVTTLDAYALNAGLDHITLVKIDAEGHDLAVLRGSSTLFSDQRISIVQFEYNQRWVYSRSFLCDAFELLQPLGYQVGKLTPRGVEFYPGWDFELETFIEGNYIACVPRVAARLPSVTWWKSTARGELV